MLKEFVEKILSMGRDELVDVDGTDLSTHQLHIPPVPRPETLMVNTLTGLVDYIKAKSEVFEFEKYIIHVMDHETVKFRGPIQGNDDSRLVLICASFQNPGIFEFGRKYNPEQFVIALQTNFVDTNDRATMLQMVGNITNERVVSSEDDGITQKVGLKIGAKLNLQGKESIPNPVVLKPYRTFLELDQPESQFVFRVHQSEEGDLPTCALYAADGGFWKNDAILKIKDYLTDELPDVPIIA